MASTDRKFYTRKGDKGKSRLLSGETVSKDDARLMTYGTLDELQSHLGMARALSRQEPFETILLSVQKDVFVACSELASTSQNLRRLRRRITATDTATIEGHIDEFTTRYGLPGGFVTPGRSLPGSALHVARAVCRRCERLIVLLNRNVGDYPELIAYFNRLSDLLFVLAWSFEVKAVVEEVVHDLLAGVWRSGESP